MIFSQTKSLLLSTLTVISTTACSPHKAASTNLDCHIPNKQLTAIPTGVKNHAGIEYEKLVFGKNTDSPILFLHALPGPSRSAICCSKEIASWGYQVHLPNLFPGSSINFTDSSSFKAARYLKKSPDWQIYKWKEDSKATESIREMAEKIYTTTGKKVIVIGNCFTGITPLSLLDSPSVSKVVLCQPATPFNSIIQTICKNAPKEKKSSLGISEVTLVKISDALVKDKTKSIHGLHYAHDPVAAIEKFETIKNHFENTQPGLSNRFKTYILYPQTIKPKSWWTKSQVTVTPESLLKPHSTIIGATNTEDLSWFRLQLRNILKDSN